MKNIIFLFAALIVTISSCRKDVLIEEPIFIPFGEDVITNLHGRVVDESGRPIPEASIYADDRTVFTNGEGYFSMIGISVPSDGFTIKANSLTGNEILRRVVPQKGTNTYEEIVLLSAPQSSAFSAADESIISNGFTSITIKPNSLVDKDGNLFQGDYLSRLIYYNPIMPDILRHMPGNLQGIDKNGDKVTLGSYGMIDIEVTDSNGEPLSLAPGNVATVQMQIPNQLMGNVPEMIPTWKLDERSGLWLEAGEVIDQSITEEIGFVFFDIDEFKRWNCDIKELNTNLAGTIKDQFGVPIENRLIVATFNSGGQDFYCTGGSTNSRGEFNTRMPKGMPLTISIYDQNCEDFIYTEKIDPLTEEINSIEIEAIISKDTYTITGFAAECSEGIPYSNATVFLYNENNEVRMNTQTNEDGFFTIHNVCYDSNFEERYKISVLDLDSGNYIYQDSLFNSEIDINVGNINFCPAQAEYINIESSFGLISFDDPHTSFDSDSLFMSTSIGDNMNFTLFAKGSEPGTHPVDYLSIRANDDILMSCSEEYDYVLCSSVNFTIDENNEILKYITGTITGVLYSGDFSEPGFISTNDITIEFLVNY